jgi:alpha-glucosidase (family GH31 glycosyl hydrolase)
VRATYLEYLEYPDQPGAYDAASREYFYGSDVLVAPATPPGTSSTTPVWFPPGRWTDYFTGTTYTGPATQNATSDWNSMPVFVKAGGIVPTRTDNVANDVQNPLREVTLTVAGGADGSYSLYEDDGRSSAPDSATTTVRYTETGPDHTVWIAPVKGGFTGQATDREWTTVFTNATAPTAVRVDGVAVPANSWTYDASTRHLTVTVPARSVRTATTISYR